MSPGAGYTLDGVSGFSHSNAPGSVTYNTGTKTVNITFPALPIGEITSGYNLAAYVPLPTVGLAPVKNAVVGLVSVSAVWTQQGLGASSWIDLTDTVFQVDKRYEATITLTPAFGYGFTQNFYYGSDLTDKNVVTSQTKNTSTSTNYEITVEYKPFMSYSSATSFGSVLPGPANSVMKAISDNVDKDNLYVKMTAGGSDLTGIGVSLSRLNCPANLIIDGGDKTVKVADQRAVLTIGDGVTVTLRNITLQGYTANNTALLVVGPGGTLILENNAIIKGNTNSNTYGGGIYIYNGGTVIMNGGTITENNTYNNFGGGVYNRGGNFTMNSGYITNNTATSSSGGGLYHGRNDLRDAFFTLNGGTISGNTANTGGGVYAAVMSTQSVIINGGTIKENTAQSIAGGLYIAHLGLEIVSLLLNGGTFTSNVCTDNSQYDGIYSENYIRIRGSVKVTNNGICSYNAVEIGGNMTPDADVNIKKTYSPGDTVLDGLDVDIANNYTKFKVNGVSGKINSSGKYQ